MNPDRGISKNGIQVRFPYGLQDRITISSCARHLLELAFNKQV
jgi:hypothetical protein